MKKSWFYFSLALVVTTVGQVDACTTTTTTTTSTTTTTTTAATTPATGGNGTYPIVDTGVTEFSDASSLISEPSQGSAFYGQDATYTRNAPNYTDNGDGTITDTVTGLMWTQSMSKYSFSNSFTAASSDTTGGYSDWRMPSVKELYSLILFTGSMVPGSDIVKYIDTTYFDQPLGDTSAGEREIDAQTWSSTEYVGTVMSNLACVFGVNFVDGRIKCYEKVDPQTSSDKIMYARFVRGSTDYGANNFADNGDQTISDWATGLMWQQADSGSGMDWEAALSYCESLTLAGHSDWKLPSAKELQSIVDYSVNSPAIDSSLFTTSTTTLPDSSTDYPYFWSSTTHMDGANPYEPAAYVAFGKAIGKLDSNSDDLVDAHGAGAQRSDPKSTAGGTYPSYFGPQNDMRVVLNHVRCVRVI